MSKAWKPPSSRPILIYFEFRTKPSLITVISMDPRPTNYLRQNIVFSYPEMTWGSFSLFLSLSVFCYFTLLLIFMKIILFFFMKIIFIFPCSGMFRNVLCSWFYRRPYMYTVMFERRKHWRTKEQKLYRLKKSLKNYIFSVNEFLFLLKDFKMPQMFHYSIKRLLFSQSLNYIFIGFNECSCICNMLCWSHK